MARVLEVLKQPDARRDWPTPPASPPRPRPFRPDADAAGAPPAEAEEEADAPFIEVGTPATAARPAASVGQESCSQDKAETTADFLQVQFQPLPTALTPPLPAPDLVAFHQPGHRVSEQYRRVLCEISVQSPAELPHVLLFTAPAQRAGTTTVVLNLAVTYARQGTGQIVLVDANFHRPAVAERLGLVPSPGLQEVLAGLACLGDAVRETAQPNLHALTAGTALRGETALLAGESMRQLLRDLRGRFHWVFVDAPAWAGHPEVIALSAACDAVYLVVADERADAPELQEIHRLMPRHGAPLRGRILTQGP